MPSTSDDIIRYRKCRILGDIYNSTTQDLRTFGFLILFPPADEIKVSLMRYRPMVGHRFLAPGILVRIKVPQRILKINIMWKSKKTKPTKEGCYIVAEFRDNKLINFSTHYCYAKDIADELIKSCPSETVNFTHWMHYSDYKKILENLSRNE